MDNKTFGLTFLAILTSALVFFGVANAGSYAVDKLIFPTEEFGDNTYIGTTNVSNMEVAGAVSLFSGKFDAWKESAALIVRYQDAQADYPLDNVKILLEETVEGAASGTQNNFVFELSKATTRTFLDQHFSPAVFSDSDVVSINEKLEAALASGQAETRIDITDDSLTVGKGIISESTFQHTLENKGADTLISALNGMQLAPQEQFSLLTFIEEQNVTEITDVELTNIASVLYSAALKTNLAIDERSTGAVQPKFIPLGQEAAINRKLGIDLSFTNTNNSSFTINIFKEGSSLTASFSGMPLVYEYVLQTGGEEKVKPRLIKQFSTFVNSGKSVKEEGSEGVRINISRAVLADGQEMRVDAVSTDFYPPVHRIEVHPLAKPVAETPANPETPGTVDPNNPNPVTPVNPDADDTTIVIIEDPANPGYDTDGNPLVYDENGNIVNEKQNEDTEKTPGYDKGGNSTNP